MIDSFVLVGVVLLAGQFAARTPLPAAVALAATLALAWPRLQRWQIVAAILAFGLGIARASAMLHADHAVREPLRETFGPPTRCAGLATVLSSPAKRGDRVAFIARSEGLECEEGTRVPTGTVLRLYAANDDLARHDRLEMVASLGVAEIFRNPETDGASVAAARTGAMLSGGVLDAEVVERSRYSPATWIDRARLFARRRIDATYSAGAAPMARALVLGESDLPEEDNEAFRVSGLSHLLAVSGTHIVVAVLGLVRILEKLFVRIERIAAGMDTGRLAAAIGIPLAWGYAEFAGSGGSVRRAALMTTTALLARVLARRPDGIRAFGLSLFAGGLADPLAAFDLSFGLSAGATAGLLVLSRPLQDRLQVLPAVLRWGASPVAATLSATLFCTPWLAGLGPSISLVGLVANLVAVPIGEMISLPACLAHLLLSPFPPLERGVALLGSGSLLAVRAIARAGTQASFLQVPVPSPTPWQLAALAIATVALLLRIPRDRKLTLLASVACLVCLEGIQIRLQQPHGKLRVTALDVGQGDSLLVDFPDGRAMLIDGGGIPGSAVDPGERVVTPVLRERRRSRLDIAILTHPDPDHVTGLASSLPRLALGQLWDTGYGENHATVPAYQALRQALGSRQVQVVRPQSACGKSLDFGGAQVKALAPCPDVEPGSTANNSSWVVKIEFGSTSALLVGDAEAAEESRLLGCCRDQLRADLLKVGHHGSRTSSSEAFLDAVRPSVAMITTGIRNRYGHPAPETTVRLQQRGIRVFRSDLHGAIVWESDGTSTRVSTAAGGQD